ncbi:hypothetical protein RFI_30791, partial [Reticulomyxa filosa]
MSFDACSACAFRQKRRSAQFSYFTITHTNKIIHGDAKSNFYGCVCVCVCVHTRKEISNEIMEKETLIRKEGVKDGHYVALSHSQEHLLYYYFESNEATKALECRLIDGEKISILLWHYLSSLCKHVKDKEADIEVRLHVRTCDKPSKEWTGYCHRESIPLIHDDDDDDDDEQYCDQTPLLIVSFGKDGKGSVLFTPSAVRLLKRINAQTSDQSDVFVASELLLDLYPLYSSNRSLSSLCCDALVNFYVVELALLAFAINARHCFHIYNCRPPHLSVPFRRDHARRKVSLSSSHIVSEQIIHIAHSMETNACHTESLGTNDQHDTCERHAEAEKTELAADITPDAIPVEKSENQEERTIDKDTAEQTVSPLSAELPIEKKKKKKGDDTSHENKDKDQQIDTPTNGNIAKRQSVREQALALLQAKMKEEDRVLTKGTKTAPSAAITQRITTFKQQEQAWKDSYYSKGDGDTASRELEELKKQEQTLDNRIHHLTTLHKECPNRHDIDGDTTNRELQILKENTTSLLQNNIEMFTKLDNEGNDLFKR